MDDKATRLLFAKLDAIITLMVFAITEGKSQTEQVRLLSAAGFQPREIAYTLGTTSNTVRVALSNLRRRKTGRSSRKGEAQA